MLEEYGGIFHHKLLPAWNSCVEGKYNYCYLKLDEEEPKMYQFGRDGCKMIDWEQFPIVAPTGLLKYLKELDKKQQK